MAHLFPRFLAAKHFLTAGGKTDPVAVEFDLLNGKTALEIGSGAMERVSQIFEVKDFVVLIAPIVLHLGSPTSRDVWGLQHPERKHDHLRLLIDAFIDQKTPNGPVSAQIINGTCSFDGALSTIAPVASPPAGLAFPYGALAFTANGCGGGGTITIRLFYPNALPEGVRYYKYLDGAWQDWTDRVTITGNTVTLVLTDNEEGDTDPTLGVIQDPSGPAFSTSPVPTLSAWGMLAMSMLLLGCAMMASGKKVITSRNRSRR